MNMKKLVIASLLLSLRSGALPLSEAAAGEKTARHGVTIVYPREGATIKAVKESFVLGTVSPADAPLRINGKKVSAYRTGSYLASIPFHSGEFKIKAVSELNGKTTEVLRTVYVSSPTVALPRRPLAISGEAILPAADLQLVAGDRISLRVTGSPGAKAEFRIKGISNKIYRRGWEPMAEKNSPTLGIYEGSAHIRPGDRARSAIIEYRLTDERGKKVKARSPAKISILKPDQFEVMAVKVKNATLRSGPNEGSEMMGYDLFLPEGVKLRAQGRIGSQVRLVLSDTESLWTDDRNLKQLPEGSPMPGAILNRVTTESGSRSVLVSFNLGEKVPYRAFVSDDLKEFALTLYYTVSNLDRIHYDSLSTQKWLDQVRWSQLAGETVKVKWKLKKKLWGYTLSYEGEQLRCRIYFAPPMKKKKKPLGGLTVAVDPGHSPEEGDGAISPQGVKEGEVAVKIASCLREKLRGYGANVVMTRDADEVISLGERSERARDQGADLFLSIHANAVPNGADPYKKGGYSVYYYQPQSFALAEKVHASYRKRIKLQDDGLHYGNLAVCRITRMPSVLIESAYLILPREEELLLKRDFQCACSEAIAKGVIQFVRSYR